MLHYTITRAIRQVVRRILKQKIYRGNKLKQGRALAAPAVDMMILLQNKDLDCFDRRAVFKFPHLSEREKASLGIT